MTTLPEFPELNVGRVIYAIEVRLKTATNLSPEMVARAQAVLDTLKAPGYQLPDPSEVTFTRLYATSREDLNIKIYMLSAAAFGLCLKNIIRGEQITQLLKPIQGPARLAYEADDTVYPLEILR